MDAAQVGAAVAKRLGATPGVMKLPAQGFELFLHKNFLKPEECAALVRRIDADRKPSEILSDHPDPEFRTSETCNLDPDAKLTREIEAKITRLTGIDPSHGETIQGQRYAQGQQFKPHHDFFYTSEPYWEEQQKVGGQRTWTLMIFLNEPESGGHTCFPKANLKVRPQTGNLLAWNNLDAGGKPNDNSLHQGMPVEAGTKYIITKWYRERPWG